MSTSSNIRLNVIYHPPCQNNTFIEECMDLFTSQLTSSDNTIFLGDFNIHWGGEGNRQVNTFTYFLKVHDLQLHCHKPPHHKGAILDWIFSHSPNLESHDPIPVNWSNHM